MITLTTPCFPSSSGKKSAHDYMSGRKEKRKINITASPPAFPPALPFVPIERTLHLLPYCSSGVRLGNLTSNFLFVVSVAFAHFLQVFFLLYFPLRDYGKKLSSLFGLAPSLGAIALGQTKSFGRIDIANRNTCTDITTAFRQLLTGGNARFVFPCMLLKATAR